MKQELPLRQMRTSGLEINPFEIHRDAATQPAVIFDGSCSQAI